MNALWVISNIAGAEDKDYVIKFITSNAYDSVISLMRHYENLSNNL